MYLGTAQHMVKHIVYVTILITWLWFAKVNKKAFKKEIRIQEAENGSSEEDESIAQLHGVYEFKGSTAV
ncbi:Hypothetical protein CINCED_3A013772 [Cinara cedri]|uniref:Uncharacterized protein n=1 Tax=Cinara cedri TaxID=506608 RepID=A0A5E4MT96_9HEMI|nr:Hypothetical protein CINCED_3A013772 [Cinara cedri]